jgi:large repetitive protein
VTSRSRIRRTCAALALIASFAAAPIAGAALNVTVTGPDSRGPQTPDAQGRFRFDNLQLRSNAQNTFTVTATDDAGRKIEKQVNITQLSLQNIVVASVRATPLPPERVIQLVNDGVIDLEDPENFNVSTFQIVLTIGTEPFYIDVPIAVGKQEEEGFEPPPSVNDPGNGNSPAPKVPDTEIIVFDQVVDCSACGFEPPRIPGVIIIEGNIRSLKEFFSVRLLLMNMSGLFTLSDVKASLEFPDGGLSNTLPADGVAVFDEIGPADGDVPGQKEREFIVRGDEIGRRPIRVNFGGFVTGPGIDDATSVPFSGSADTQVEVKGPPDFLVRVSHPDRVDAYQPYELRVEITNSGDAPALYASLDLDVGADADLVECAPPVTPDAIPVCEPIDGPVVRQLQHLYPGDRVTESFTVLPYATGDITSCIGVSSQNLQLQVLVGAIGCLTGKLPSTRGVPSGIPTVSVVPFPNALGVGIDSPVVAFFSEKMAEASITLGEGGSFRVFGPNGEIAPGRLRFAEVTNKTVAIWQAEDGITNRLAGNANYRVQVTQGARDLDGNPIFSEWISSFDTTSPTDDRTPPQLTLGIEPGVDPLHVLPGQIVQVNAYAADQGTGVARIELRLEDQSVADAPSVLIDQKTKFGADEGPTLFAIDSGNLLPGHTYQARATAIDGAGNAQDGTIPFVLETTVQPPQIVLPEDPAAPILQGISLDVTPLSVSTTTKSVIFFLDEGLEPMATMTLAPFQTQVVTLSLPLGAHTVRAIATDALGQTGEDTLSFELVENPNEPIVTFSGAADGARFVAGTPLFVNGSAEDPSGIASMRFALDDPNGAPLPNTAGALRIETTDLAEGAHRLYLIATNRLGVSNDAGDPASSLDFLVQAVVNGPPPAPPALAPLVAPVDGFVAISGTASPGATVTVRNLRTGVQLSVIAAADGRFSASLEAEPGDALEAIVVDLAQSQQPSTAATATVPAPRLLTGISVAPDTFTLIGQSATRDLVVTGFYSDGGSADVTASATFRSSASTVASVSGTGRVVANARGAATITATVGAFSDTAAATIEIRTLQSISVAPSTVILPAVAATQALTVTGHYSDATTTVLTNGLNFASSAPAVIGVTGNVVRALAVGSASITVSASGVPPVLVPVVVDVATDLAPTVAFLAPSAGTDYERGDTVTVTARAQDAVGVTRVTLTASGATSYSETRQVTPSATLSDQTFSFAIAADAPIGGAVTLSLQAEDTGGHLSTLATRTVDVVDATAPSVSIDAPAIDAIYGYDDEVEVVVAASDLVGVAQLRYVVDGIAGATETQTIAPPTLTAGATFHFRVPIGLVASEVSIRAFARDASGNEGASAPVPITISDADTTAPETVAIAASAPSGATTTVSYEVTSGLADLDHVELYFRRGGIGTFSRYTGPLGSGSGEFTPQSGAVGTIAFDATRMGGDGAYEFFTVGVDNAGNREAPPEDAGAIIGDDGVLATIATGAPVTVINSLAEISNASFDDQNLRIDGATVTLVGSHSFRNVELVNGAVLTHRETTQTEAYGIEVSAWTLSVDATSRIDVVARGHLGGNRAGLGETAHTSGFAAGAQNGSGGSYGGLGGDYAGNGPSVPNPVYGNLVNPVDLGSGGGGWSGAGGDGGGRVLIGAINLVVDGAIRANGGLSAGTASGEGSGGSINLTLRTLSGRGAIAADGGTTNGSNHTGGGGGRIAVRSLDRATYDAALLTARGGDGYYGDGADGTVFLLGEGETGGELVINGVGASSPITDLIIPPGQSFDSITLQNGANVIAQGPIVLTQTLRLRGNSRLAHPTASEAGLSINAREVIVESGSAIDVTGRGYLGGNKTGLGETGHALGFTEGSQNGTGGSHGGVGGDFSGNGASVPTPVYGDPKQPNRLGAGGGAWGGNGGDGGGFIRLVASDRLVVDGAIRANGGISSGSASGEGAGGSVWIDTGRLAGTGTISADGGTTNGSSHVGGGGGRVAIHAQFVDPNADLAGLRNVTTLGGDGYYGDAAAGTVYLHLPADADGTLFLDGVMPAGQTQPVATELPPIGPGVAAAVTADTLTVDGTLRAFTPNALVGLRLNPNLAQAQDFAIASNTADTITVVTPNENGAAFASVATPGASYAGAWHLDDVRFRRGGFLELADPLFVAQDLALAENALLVHPRTTQVYAGDLVIDAGTVTIDATSRIDVTGRGHLGGNRAGLGQTSHTLGFAAGAQPGTGGSHGGLGGAFGGNGGGVPNPTYGNPSAPRELGAGGGAWGGDGGDGGGRVAIVADTMVVDGALRADGGISSGSASGEGAGGSLDLRVGSLSGSGSLSASGGSLSGGNHVGGGGGRIAIHHGGVFSLPLANIRAVGGDGYYGDGGHGSVFVHAPGQTYGDVIFDGHGFTPPVDSVVIPDGLAADNLILRDGVRAIAGQVAVDTLRLESGATLTHAAQSESGLQIDVRRLEVASGAAIDVSGRGYLGGNKAGLGQTAIDVSGRGYLGGNKAGLGQTAHTLGFASGAEGGTGGSHGGLGGVYAGNGGGVPNPVYGDPRRPGALGAGGGAWGGNGGDGGGALHIVATDSVVVDGAIRANGGLSSGSASGEGAGGSVWIQTATFGGAGTVAADGGTANGGNHTGGGGGRVAIYADAADASADLLAARRATAYGGDGYYGDGAPGTVFVEIAGAETLIFDAGRTSDRWTPEASLPAVGPGVAAAMTSDSLTVDGNLPSPHRLVANHLSGTRLNPNTAQDESFVILTNTADAITVATPNENGVHFADVALSGAPYTAAWRFGNVVLRGGVSVALFDPLVVTGSLTLTERSLLTHPETTTVYAGGLVLSAGTLAIDAISSIDVTARGHLGGGRFGLGAVAHTVGFAPGAQGGTGGSYGGLGGDYAGNGANVPNPVYGSANEPVDLGSGGGSWSGDGGDGGGRVRIDVGALILDGAIRANGGVSFGSASGEGSGGSVNVRAASISGSGPIAADGGTTNGGNHTGGGGGRIAIRYGVGAVPLPNPITVNAGDGNYGDGQPGSVFVEGP